jgi:23S rRNA (adenine2503-C2)-methyltransferase
MQTILDTANKQLSQPKTDLLGLTLPELQAWLKERGEPTFRAKQIYQWVYKHLVDDFAAMSNLPQTLRQRLQDEASIGTMVVCNERHSKDGRSRKILLELADGKSIESGLMLYPQLVSVPSTGSRKAIDSRSLLTGEVYLPNPYKSSGNAPGKGSSRATVCVSSQAGCACRCTFCATGQMGFGRHLSTGEIVEQVLQFARRLRRAPWTAAGLPKSSPIHHITNLVLMGMGEPLHNYNNVLRALRILNSSDGYHLGARHITLSTVGLVPGIRKLAQEALQINLAVSLHATTDELRSQNMPVNRRYPLAQLFEAIQEYIAATRRQVTFEYILLAGVNDTVTHAQQLAKLLAPLHQFAHVNCIPVNATSANYKTPGPDAIRTFRNVLFEHGISNTVRAERGDDIEAACGQLHARFEKSK